MLLVSLVRSRDVLLIILLAGFLDTGLVLIGTDDDLLLDPRVLCASAPKAFVVSAITATGSTRRVRTTALGAIAAI